MKALNKILVLLLAGALCSMAFASEIYRWTDPNGNVHYDDRPLSPDSERLDIRSRSTDTARVQAMALALTSQRIQRAEEEAAEKAKRLAGQPSPDEAKAQAQEKDERCRQYRADLERMMRSRRLYQMDENGERNYLNEEEMAASRARVQAQVEDYCSS